LYRLTGHTHIIGERQDRETRKRPENVLPLNPHGVKDDDIRVDNINSAPTIGGTSADYLTARIACDHPQILAKKSPRGSKYPKGGLI
jgi:hypothetical protein